MINQKNNYYIWDKNDKLPINNYFNTSEFTCKCKYDTCKEQKIAIELIDLLTKIREEIQTPITITSGFRCQEHQAFLRSSGVNTVVAKKSTHELGDAADAKAPKLQLSDFLLVSEKYFLSIGLANTFLHLDLRKDKKRRWKY